MNSARLPLISPDEFYRPDETGIYLDQSFTGRPWKSARQVFEQYLRDIGTGEGLIDRLQPVKQEARELCANLVGGTTETVAISFTANATSAAITALQPPATPAPPTPNEGAVGEQSQSAT